MLGAAILSPAMRAAERSNIVFFLADDLGWVDIGSNGSRFYETPNIDGLALRGMRFTQGYAACCVCSPTRGSIITGKHPPRFGITDFIPGMRSGKLLSAPNADHLPLEETTIAEALRDSGYAKFFAGKWHLGGGEYSPNAQGFGPGLVSGDGSKESVQFWYPKSDTPPPDHEDDPKTTDRIADAAVQFIDAHKDQPFFAYLPFLAVHQPIGARADLVAKYEKKKASAPPDAWGQERERQVRLVQNNAVYAAMIEQLDTAVGRVITAMESTSCRSSREKQPSAASRFSGTILTTAIKAALRTARCAMAIGNSSNGMKTALELYNLAQDIGEKNNLAIQHPETVKALHEKLNAWRMDVNAVMPGPNPNIDPNTKPAAQPRKK